MTAFADLSEFLNRATGGNSGLPEHRLSWVYNRVAGAAVSLYSGRLTDIWRFDKSNGCAGAALPSTPAQCDKSTLGAWPFSNPGSGRERWLSCLSFGGLINMLSLMPYDRLAHVGGGSLVVNSGVGTQKAFSMTPGRNTDGELNFIAIVVESDIGSTAFTISCEYTNQDGTTGRNTPSAGFGGTQYARQPYNVQILPLQAGDTGVRSVQGLTVSGSPATAGTVAVVLGRYLTMPTMMSASTAQQVRSFITEPGPVKLETDMCLAFFAGVSAATIIDHNIYTFSCER